jgi:hypothetical protein
LRQLQVVAGYFPKFLSCYWRATHPASSCKGYPAGFVISNSR